MSYAPISITEDEASLRRFLVASLRAEGFSVAKASTGNEGLRVITQDKPALAMLDLGLPELEGTALIKTVREWSAMPILVISARGDETAKIAALDAGAASLSNRQKSGKADDTIVNGLVSRPARLITLRLMSVAPRR